MTEKMHYFRPVEGHACRRFGSQTFIGCARGPKGYTWNTDVVVAISDTEMMPYRKDYTSYLRHGDLISATEAEYKEWLDKRKAATEAAKAAREKRIADAKTDAKKAEAKATRKAKAVAKKAAASTPTTDSGASASEATGGNAQSE